MEVAVAVADKDGLAGLTMRSLAHELGVEAMSLYHHVKNKDDILNGMVDAVFAQIELPDPTSSDWKHGMRTRAYSARTVLNRHPWAIALLESRANPGLATLKHHDAVLGCLRRGGLSLELTGHAYAVLDAFIYGFVQQEQSLPLQSPKDTRDVATQIMSQMPAGQFPHLVEFATGQVLQPGYAFGNEFGFCLELILDGLERAHLCHGSRE